MMGERQVQQDALFCEFSLERHVPAEHLVRSIDRFVELDRVRRELASFYSELGKPRERVAASLSEPPGRRAPAPVRLVVAEALDRLSRDQEDVAGLFK
jgi:hypothetical protein